MRLLLDTHVFLWFVTGDLRLPPAWDAAVRDPLNDVFLSVASVWEAVVKHATGKLPLPGPPEVYISQDRARHRIAGLDVTEDTVKFLAGLPPIHRDPFDRIIVASALQHDLTLMSLDAQVRSYPVKLLPP